jgi:hypothetical protein
MTRNGQTRDPLPGLSPGPVWVRTGNDYRPAPVKQSDIGQAFNTDAEGVIRIAGFTGDDPLFIKDGNNIRLI